MCACAFIAFSFGGNQSIDQFESKSSWTTNSIFSLPYECRRSNDPKISITSMIQLAGFLSLLLIVDVHSFIPSFASSKFRHRVALGESG